jgi:hypothetical protein
MYSSLATKPCLVKVKRFLSICFPFWHDTFGQSIMPAKMANSDCVCVFTKCNVLVAKWLILNKQSWKIFRAESCYLRSV